MSATCETAVPTGRKKIAQGNALGNPPTNTSSPEGAKENGELPKGWRRVAIKDMADSIQYGLTASAAERKDGPRFLRITDIQDGRVDWRAVPSCDISKEQILKYKLSSGDLVFARTGATTGKSFLIGECPEAVFASYLIRVRVSADVDSRYLSAFFQSPDYWRQIEGGKRGIGQPNVNGTVLGEVQFPLAPLDEQRRIVAEIEKQFTRLEAGVTALRRVQANLKRYRAAVLKAACEGRLVPTEAELHREQKSNTAKFETGEELLIRILTERRQNWQGRGQYKEPAAPNTTNLSALPEGYTWASFGQICRVQGGFAFKSADYVKEGVPLVRISNLVNGRVQVSEDTVFLPSEFAAANPSFLLRKGDVLIAMSGATTGKMATMEDDVPALLNQRVGRFVLSSEELSNAKFVSYLVMQITQKVLKDAYGAAQPNISPTEIEEFAIPLPPLAEQTRIVAEVERRLSVVEELEAAVSANLQRATRLRQSILQKAFTGQLVSQETVAPPANVLELPKTEIRQRPNRHFARALLSAEIVHQLHSEPTFGRIKHQKIFHLCEHIAQIEEIEGQYHREVAGPLDNKLIYANEAELKKQKWYREVHRNSFGHAYEPLAKAGVHRKYVEGYWPDKLRVIEKLIELMRKWDTDRCEIFCTAYAAWNDLVLWGKEPTEAAILHEILERWHDSKRRFPEERWHKAIRWMKEMGFVPTGFGKPTSGPK